MVFATPKTDEMLDKVAAIVRQVIDQKFEGLPIVFNEIIVELRTEPFFEDSGKYIDIKILYTGDGALLDPEWTSSLIGIILPMMEAEGIHVTSVPSKSFILKSEWDELQLMDPYDELD